MAQGQSGRTNKSGSQQTGVNQTASLRIADIRSNYNYPNWFDTTMGYFRDGRISSQAFESAYANLAKQGLITLKTGGTPATPSGSFESLFPKQTSQLIKIGQDTTALGQINVRQDETLAGYRSELDAAFMGRESNLTNISMNTGKIEELFTGQQTIFDSIKQKSNRDHTHGSSGKAECGFWDIQCKIDEGFQGLGKLALIGGVGILAFFLIKKRIGL